MNTNDPVADGRLTDSDSSVPMDSSVPAVAPPPSKDCVYTFSDNCDSDDGEELKFKIKNILQAPLKDETAATTTTAQVVNTDTWHAAESAAATFTTNTLVSATTDESDMSGDPRRAIDDDDRMGADNFPGFTPPTAVAAFVHNHDRTPPPDPNNDHVRLSSPTATTAAAAAAQPLYPHQPSLVQSPLAGGGIPSHSPALPSELSPVRRPTNGCIPKTGKPLTFASNSASNASTCPTDERPTPSLGKRPLRMHNRPKRKALVTMYHSQISDNTLGGIKLKLKKSSSPPSAVSQDAISQAATAVAATITGHGATSGAKRRIKRSAVPAKKSRKRSVRKPASDSTNVESGAVDGSAVKRVRKSSATKARRKPAGSTGAAVSVVDQTDWGKRLPEPALYLIFQEAVRQEGALPTLVRLGKVCLLWQSVSLASSLWQTLDLSRWTKEKFRTELRLKWLIENRCTSCVELNVSNWKITNVHSVLTLMAATCPYLMSVTFSGWKSFTSDDLLVMAEQLTSLRRIDLSAINIEASHKSAVSIQALCFAIQLMKGRLTHLHLSNNKLAGIPQIVTALATFCPNLELLDLSNVSTVANSHGVLHLEKLQTGCQMLRVLRITNSHITLGPATLEEQMCSPGFPELEELSIAALSDESRLINDDYLQRILKTSTKLQLLDVRGCARLTHESMIRLPTWDLKHLFLSGCAVTRDLGSGLELIASKWAHSLIEFDLAWSNVQQTVDSALRVIAEKGSEAPMSHLNLCGSSVSQSAVVAILQCCPQLSSINLSSCRGLPRGVKRLMQGTTELNDLREALGLPTNKSSASPMTTTDHTSSMSIYPAVTNFNNNNSSSSSTSSLHTTTVAVVNT